MNDVTSNDRGMKKAFKIDEAKVRGHADQVVRHSVEESLIEMYLAGVSVRRVEDITAALWGTKVVHWYRNAWSHVPKGKVKELSAMLKAIHASEDREAALKKAEDVVIKLEKMKLKKAAAFVRESVHETLRYMGFLRERWTRLRTEQPAGAADEGDQASDEGGGRVPGREQCVDAQRREA